MSTINIVFQLIILLFSAIIHEVAHGYAALFQGDPTAKYENRLTLNPLRHIDPFGSVILPLFLYISELYLPPGVPHILFGWAKPVPFNPYNLRNRKWGEALVALAGPAVNILIALVFGLVLRLGLPYMMTSAFLAPAIIILEMIVAINILLAVFNLVPIPPLDGSKVLFAFLPASAANFRRFMERYSIWLVLIFIFFLWNYLTPVISLIFYWFTGMSL